MSYILQHTVLFNGEWTWVVIFSIVLLVAVITVTSIKLNKLKKQRGSSKTPAPEGKN